ncbi:MAG TPA: hypothetical protein VJT71_09470 [Pyrinomonadaceae bacterium]|nr:hypothetical protein [Pyrinomonadaceae bacterium]
MAKSGTDPLSEIEEIMGETWLPRIYRDRIMKMRTRAYEFASLPKNSAPQIHHTLLGIELKVGRHRMLCPDLATARYLSVFARAGCGAVAIPYDITKISQVADELESSWHRMLLLAEQLAPNSAAQGRLRRILIAKVREEVTAAGSGPRMPRFEHSTKKR